MADIYAPTLVSRTNEANSATNTLFTSISDGTDTLLVNADGSLNAAVTSIIPGVGATNLGKAEDAAHTSGDTGVMSLAVRRDTATSGVSADGDYATFNVNSTGDLYVSLDGETITITGSVAVTSVIPGTGATNLGKAEDSAHTSGDVGVMALAVRSDAGGSLVSTDGDYSPLSINSTGELRVAASVTVASDKAEDSAHVSGDTGSFSLAVRRDTATSGTSADGDYASFNVNSTGDLYVTLDSEAVTVSSITTSVTPGTGAAHLGKAEDAAHTSGDTGVMALAVRRDTATSGTSADGDYATVNVNSSGDVYTTLDGEIVRVSATTAANSSTNPIFVQTVSTAITGEVHSYDTTAAVASGASDNHDYTVVTHFKLKSVKFSNSGGMKVEVQYGPVASLVTAYVGFIPLAGGSDEVTFDPPIEVPTTGTGTVRVIRTNRNFVAVDVYSTIVGIDA